MSLSRFDAMLESIFAPASREEAEERKARYPEIKMKEWLGEFLGRDDVRRNSDGSYDVDGDVDLSGMELGRLPVRFWVVGGNFDCSQNVLTSLNGAPRKVGGDFICYVNLLDSLKGAPDVICGNFWCQYNRLTSLEGIPNEVNGDFWCKSDFHDFTERDVREVCEVGGGVYV